MKMCETHKYQVGFYHVIQLLKGSNCCYIVIHQSKINAKFKLFKASFSRIDEAIICADKLKKKDDEKWKGIIGKI